jgi:6-pyruvoyltetrahydropterin/6-carboxytetrahydropterin synthase
MKWMIDKTIEGCYGHRVHNQQLIEEFSHMNVCKCKRLHGHQLTLKVFLESDVLQDGMVTDFNHLNWLKKFIDDYIDHKFILDKNDPLYSHFIEDAELTPIFIDGVPGPVGHIVDCSDCPLINQDNRDWLESFFVVNFVPTSECLSKWIFEIAAIKMAALGRVVRVDWHETPKSRASYLND